MTEHGAKNIQILSVGNSLSLDPPPTRADVHPFAAGPTASEGHLAPRQSMHDIHLRKVRIALAIIDEHAFTRGSIARTLKKLSNSLEITSFVTCDECIESTKHYDVILYNMHDRVSQNSNYDRFSSLKKVLPVAPVIILSDDDSYGLVSAAFDIGVRGYIPTASTTPELALEIMYLVKSGGTFVPASSLSPQGISPKGIPNPVTTRQFTPRQMAVLHRLKLGKTNKIIAYELQISESSVKSHIRNIMNKLNATNRTEVACRALELEC
jgi:DNA-binding NarL/FixJ family response regulator